MIRFPRFPAQKGRAACVGTPESATTRCGGARSNEGLAARDATPKLTLWSNPSTGRKQDVLALSINATPPAKDENDV